MSVAVQMGTRNRGHYRSQVYGVAYSVVRVNTLRT